MEFRKIAELPECAAEIRHRDRLMLMGSCFSESMGRMLAGSGFRTLVNPFGILYNPASIALALDRMLSGKLFGEDELICHGGLWSSLMHHGSFSGTDSGACLRHINSSLSEGAEMLRRADWLMITLGTARVYEWKETGTVVGNCHRLPDHKFSRRLLGVDEIVDEYTALLGRLREGNKELKTLFTVSPIRHTRDGAHGNQISKSTLMLAVEKICTTVPQCYYFPSYEIMMDELRDYRFYCADMVHPSPVAEQYIWERFCKAYFRQPTMEAAGECEAVRRGLEHRPLNPDTEDYCRFVAQLEEKIDRLKKKYPYVETGRLTAG